MKKYKVRIEEINITDFMNIRKGTLSLVNTNTERRSSILGIYGQNGSGKTALVNAFDILKYLLSGNGVPSSYTQCITCGASSSAFTFKFILKDDEENTEQVIYSFSISAEEPSDTGNRSNRQDRKQIRVFDEVIKTRLYREKDERIGRIIDTSGKELISPRAKRIMLFGTDDTLLMAAATDAEAYSKSLIFSEKLLSILATRAERNHDDALSFYFSLISSLSAYGSDSLFVINTTNNAFVAMNAQPLNFKLGKSGGTIAVPVEGPAEIPSDSLILIRKILYNVNIVLRTIIPGLTVSLDTFDKDKEDVTGITLMSERNGIRIPFSYESEGIKKLVSIINLMANVMTDDGITVVIDELDTSIFEYLLGEILYILSGNGFGQLIFTAHNLRPLETLDKNSVAFTTTDENKRFIRLRNIKGSHNMRDTYYRSIFLGVPYDNLYDRTNNSDIELALLEAGGIDDEN